MECTRCYTHMQLVKRENHRESFLEWHQCPLCRRIEFIAQPTRHEIDLQGGMILDGINRPVLYS